MKKNNLLLALSILSLIATAIIYSKLPDQIPMHWNIAGEIDRYGSKSSAFITGALPLLGYYMFLYLPKIDPKKANYVKHSKAYSMTSIAIIISFIFFHWIALLSAMGYDLRINNLIPIVVGVLFIVIGNYMPQLRKNYFVGVKNPWTLSDDTVWKKTHRLCGYMFYLMGILFIIQSIIGNKYLSYSTFAILIASVIYINVYSYLIYRKITKGE